MFDQRQAAEFRRQMEGDLVADPLAGMAERDLRRIMNEIQQRLPKTARVNDLDLEAELVEQYVKTKDLMDTVMDDEAVPVNQKAQLCNSVVSTLGQLVKLQEDLRREETLKIMEACLIEAIKVLPDDTKASFFREYERLAVKAGLVYEPK